MPQDSSMSSRFSRLTQQNTVDYLSVTAEILNLTRSMLKAAQAAEWEKVQKQEKRRQVLLKQLPSSNDLATVLGRDAVVNLEVTVQLNARLIELGDQVKDDLRKEINLLQRGRKANLAYL